MGNCCSLKAEFCRADEYFASVKAVLGKLETAEIDRLVDLLLKAHRTGRTIFLFGNGGSAALASHMACDLGKGLSAVAETRPRVLSLTDNVPLMTAWANDTAYEFIFSEQIESFVQPGDVAFAISGSGNSPNVLNALRAARRARASTVGLTGFQGGRMKELCDICIVVPSDNIQVIEDVHVMTSHAIFSTARALLQKPRAMAATAGD